MPDKPITKRYRTVTIGRGKNKRVLHIAVVRNAPRRKVKGNLAMALSKDEQAQLDALTAKASEPDDDFSIEIWDETGAGAKVPFSQGKSWLARFGIGVEKPAEDKPAPKPAADKTDDDKPSNVATRHFGPKKPA